MAQVLIITLFAAYFVYLWRHRSGRKYWTVIGWKDGKPYKWRSPDGHIATRID